MRKRLLALSVAAGAVLALAVTPRAYASPAAVQDPCGVSAAMPPGDCGPFRSVFGENFNGDNVPLGSFSDCDHNPESPSQYCGGLPAGYRKEFWAYPRGWYDTANPKNHSNGNSRSFGGEYRADDTTWVGPSSTGDGQLHVRMFRPNSGDNHVAAIVPTKCGFLGYGKYSERFRVSQDNPGFKVAHLFYASQEIDYPEAGGSFRDDPSPEGFVHGSTEATYVSGDSWNSWHTYSIEIVPNEIKFYLDGTLRKVVRDNFTDKTNWVLQNESSLSGAYAVRGSSVQIDTTWVKCWKYQP